jgi:predicted trehalose synthase
MAEKTPSQSQQATSIPVDAFRKAMDEQLNRWNQVVDETQKAQARWFEQSNTAIDELATMMKAGLKYQADLASDFRKLALETARKSADLFPH